MTGKVPFPGGSAREKVRRHLHEHPWHPRQFCEDISEEFVELIADMMEKDPQKRLQTAEEVVNRLEPWAADMAHWSMSSMSPTPWTVPPIPTDSTVDPGLHETFPDEFDEESGNKEQDAMLATMPISSNLQDTLRSGSQDFTAPPLDWHDDAESEFQWTIGKALALALPAAILAGIVMGILIGS